MEWLKNFTIWYTQGLFVNITTAAIPPICAALLASRKMRKHTKASTSPNITLTISKERAKGILLYIAVLIACLASFVLAPFPTSRFQYLIFAGNGIMILLSAGSLVWEYGAWRVRRQAKSAEMAPLHMDD